MDAELAAALDALERSFHVHLISTFDPVLACAPANRNADRWLRDRYSDFDQFPVREGGRTIGVLLRNGPHGGKLVRDAMKPLRDGLVVSGDMPIADLIPQLKDQHFRLVLRGERISGLVTQSDLLKLPVRMLVFGLVSHLETSLRAIVRTRFTSSEWLHKLPEARRKNVGHQIRSLSKARLEPDPLEVTRLGDMSDILGSDPNLGETFASDMMQVRALRNDVAHSKPYVIPTVGVGPFVDRFVLLQDLIERASRTLAPSR